MPKGKPATTLKCCSCNGPNAKCKGCRCAKQNILCLNCSAVNCSNREVNCSATASNNIAISILSKPNSDCENSDHRHCPLNNHININYTMNTRQESDVLSIQDIFSIVIQWKPNLFRLPKCSESKQFISELARIFRDSLTNSETFTKYIIFGHLILQRNSRQSPKSLKSTLSRRLDMWFNNDYAGLYAEASALQNMKALKIQPSKSRDWRKKFVSLVESSRLNTAMHLLDNDSYDGVPLQPEDVIGSKTVRELLLDKHPVPSPLVPHAVNWSFPITVPNFHPVIFDSIDSELIIRMAKRVKGGAGPSGIDAQSWLQMLTKFGHESAELTKVLSTFAKSLATELMPTNVINVLASSRLIALSKKSGIRPIGIGDVSRRIMSKAILSIISNDIQEVCGRLQMCAGQRAGVECVTHAVRECLLKDPDAVLLTVDADNAFNRINRKAALANISRICPSMSTILHNFYDNPSNFSTGDSFIKSQEGFTQGDVLAMPAFAVATLPLLLNITEEFPNINQFWYADDGNLIGEPVQIYKAFKFLCDYGRAFGFHVNSNKCVLLTSPENADSTRKLFNETGIDIVVDGTLVLGAPIGTDDYINKTTEQKISNYCSLVNRLADVGILDLQISYTSMTRSLQHKWIHLQRTTNCSIGSFDDLYDTIQKRFDKLFNLKLPDDDYLWPLFTLPIRLGGLGIADPRFTAIEEFKSSKDICTPYLNGLYGVDLRTEQSKRIALIGTSKIDIQKSLLRDRVANVGDNLLRIMEHLQVKGASSWLSTYPTSDRWTRVSNVEFRDALAARYHRLPLDAPSHCPCGEHNSLAHSLTCPTGGHPSIRHDSIRDIFSKTLTEICDNVQKEPTLLPVNSSIHFERISTSRAHDARLDIACCGFYGSRSERTLFDTCVFNVFAPSNLSKSAGAAFTYHETRKFAKYQERVTAIERANFAPIVLSCFGGAVKSSAQLIQRIAQKMAIKNNHSYSEELTKLRSKIGIQLARSISMCIRGPRSARHRPANSMN